MESLADGDKTDEQVERLGAVRARKRAELGKVSHRFRFSFWRGMADSSRKRYTDEVSGLVGLLAIDIAHSQASACSGLL